MRFQRFLVPVYYWKTVEIVIAGVNYSENGLRMAVKQFAFKLWLGPHVHTNVK
jgi:hypothetical protein